MADEYKAESGSPGSLYRQFKQTGYHPVSGVPVYAEIVALEALSIGGGGSNVQYTEGDTDSTITGTAVLWEDTSDTLRSVSAAKPLPVNVVAGGAGGGAVTVADGADVTLGALADAAVGDASGSLNAHARQIAKLLGAALTVATHAVTQSGTWTVQPGNTANTTAWKVDGSAVTQPVSGTFWQATQPVSGTVDTELTTADLDTGAGTDTRAVVGLVGASSGGGTLISANVLGGLKTDISYVSGNTVNTQNGTAGTGTQRVVIASDQTQLTNALKVDGSAVTQPVSGTFWQATQPVSGTVTASNTAGDVASDGVDSGNPVKIGGIARTAPVAVSATADRVNAMFDLWGKMIVRESLREDLGNQQTQISSSTSETTIVTADGTYKLDLYSLILTNSSATATKVTIKDDTAGTTRFVFMVPAGETRGFSVSPSGAHKQAAANKNWTATCGTSVAALEVTAMWTRSL